MLSMKVDFGQIYAEVGVSFGFTNTVLIELCERIDGLGRVFEHYKKLFKTDDFFVVFIISATMKHDTLSVKGPTTLSKHKTVEFALHIPYKKTDSFSEQMSYALNFVGEGIDFVFRKYKTDPTGICEIINEVKELICANPEKYEKWTKS